MNDLIREALENAGSRAPRMTLDIDLIEAKGRRRRKVTALVQGFGIASVALAGVAVVVLLGPGRPERLPVVDGPDITLPAGPDITLPAVPTTNLEETPVRWTSQDATVGSARTVVQDDTYHYLLSTAPGVTQDSPSGTPRALYRSADLIQWDILSFGDDIRPMGIAATESAVYLVTTAPGDRSGELGMRLGSSGDRGETWSYQDFSIPVFGPRTAEGSWTLTGVAAGDAGVLALVLGGGVGPNGYGLLYSSDGETFNRIDAPLSGPTALYALDDGFAVVDERSRLWITRNGSEWQEAENQPRLDWISAVVSFDGGVLLSGSESSSSGESVLAWSPDGLREWQAIDPFGLESPERVVWAEVSTTRGMVGLLGRAEYPFYVTSSPGDTLPPSTPGASKLVLVVATQRDKWEAVSLDGLPNGLVDQLLLDGRRLSLRVGPGFPDDASSTQFFADLDG